MLFARTAFFYQYIQGFSLVRKICREDSARRTNLSYYLNLSSGQVDPLSGSQEQCCRNLSCRSCGQCDRKQVGSWHGWWSTSSISRQQQQQQLCDQQFQRPEHDTGDLAADPGVCCRAYDVTGDAAASWGDVTCSGGGGADDVSTRGAGGGGGWGSDLLHVGGRELAAGESDHSHRQAAGHQNVFIYLCMRKCQEFWIRLCYREPNRARNVLGAMWIWIRANNLSNDYFMIARVRVKLVVQGL